MLDNYTKVVYNIVTIDISKGSVEYMVERSYYLDRYNFRKIWEVSKLKGGYYLRQYINGKQFGKGIKTSRKYIEQIGILDFDEIDVAEVIEMEKNREKIINNVVDELNRAIDRIKKLSEDYDREDTITSDFELISDMETSIERLIDLI